MKFIIFGSICGVMLGNTMYKSQSSAPAIVKKRKDRIDMVLEYLKRDELRELGYE